MPRERDPRRSAVASFNFLCHAPVSMKGCLACPQGVSLAREGWRNKAEIVYLYQRRQRVSSHGGARVTSTASCQQQRSTHSCTQILISKDRIEDALHAGPIRKDAHGPRPPSHLPEASLSGVWWCGWPKAVQDLPSGRSGADPPDLSGGSRCRLPVLLSHMRENVATLVGSPWNESPSLELFSRPSPLLFAEGSLWIELGCLKRTFI